MSTYKTLPVCSELRLPVSESERFVLALLLSKGQELSELSVEELASEELELLDESSFFAQEMMVRLKRDMRIMYKTLFNFFLTTKSKILIVGMLVD